MVAYRRAKCQAQHQRGQSALSGDLLDADRRVLQQFLRPQQPLGDQPLVRGGPGPGHELAGEVPRGHERPRRKIGYRDGLIQVSQGPVVHRGHTAVRRVVGRFDQRRDELRLAAVPVRRHDHPARDRVGHRGAVVQPDQMQAGVNPRGRAGAGDDLAVVDVQDIGIDLDQRIALRKLGGPQPVGGGPAAVQQAGRGQHERPGAVAEHAATAPGEVAECRQHGLGGRYGRLAPAHHDAEVRGAEPVQAGVDHDRQADVGADHPRRRGRDRVVVPGQPLGAAVTAEDLRGHAEPESRDAFVGQHRD